MFQNEDLLIHDKILCDVIEQCYILIIFLQTSDRKNLLNGYKIF